MKPHIGRRAAGALVIGAAVALVAGCATAPTTVKSAATGQAAAHEATLVLSLTSNSTRVRTFTGLEVTRLSPEGKLEQTFSVPPVGKEVTRDTALLAGHLPAGEYKITKLLFGDTYVRVTGGGQELLGSFKVTPGGIVDLGRLVMTAGPAANSVLLGRSRIAWSNGPLALQMVPELRALFDKTATGGWTRSAIDDDRVEALARLRPVGADGVTELSNGEVAAVSRLGTVLMRSPGGQWSAARTGKLESLLWLAPYEAGDARLVVVGELNSLYKMRRDGSFEALDAGNLPPGNLLFVAGNDRVGWFVAHQRESKVTLYRSPTIARGQWTPLREADIAFSFWSGASAFWAWSTAAGFTYATSSGEIQAYDFTAGQWRQHATPNGHRIVNILRGHADSLALLTSPGGGFAGAFAGSWLSRDGGASWQEIKQPFHVKVTPPLMTGPNRLLVLGGVFSDAEYQGSSDMGATWLPHGKAGGMWSFAETLTFTPTQGLFSVDPGRAPSGTVTIRRSADEGRSWQTEYNSVVDGSNLAAYRP